MMLAHDGATLLMPKSISSGRRFIAFLIALLVGAVVSNLVKEGVLKKVDLAVLVAETSHETRLSFNVGFRDHNGVFHLTERVRALIFPGPADEIRLRNLEGLGDTVQIQVQHPLRLSIHQLKLFNSRADTWTILEGEELHDHLRPADDRSLVTLEGDHVVMKALKPVAKATLYVDLHQRNQVLRYGLALLFAMLTYIVICHGHGFRIHGVADMFPNGQSRYLVELDGLRGLAALTVMLEHTWSPFAGIGATGVWLFFILSGYLLTQPFINRPERAADPAYVGAYMVRRLGRILPMYLAVVFVAFGFNDKTPLLIEHLLFLEASGHFWTIPQELAFYLFLPFFMFIGYLAHRISPRLFLPTMIVLCVAFLWNPGIAPFHLRGNGITRPPYIGWFLMGVVLAAAGPHLESIRERLRSRAGHAIGLAGAAFLVFILSASSYGLTSEYVMQNVTLPVNFPRVFGIAAAIIMLLVIVAPGSPLGMVLRLWPLRAVGIVAYSFYLLHPLMITLIMDFSEKFYGYSPAGPPLFIIASILTWLVSLFTYSQIERPFLSRSRPAA